MVLNDPRGVESTAGDDSEAARSGAETS